MEQNNLTDILSNELSREDQSSCNIIHLYKDNGFYRAYEFSAWLICTFCYTDELCKINGTKYKPLNVTRKRIKNSDKNETFCFIGFPFNSLEKFIPEKITQQFNIIDDTSVDILINNIENFASYKEVLNTFNKWKESISIAKDKNESVQQNKQNNGFQTNQPKLSVILSQVLSFPIEQKTPIDCMMFISDLRKQLSEIF